MGSISSTSGYNNSYLNYGISNQSSNTSQMQAFDKLRDMQMNMLNSLTGDSSNSANSNSSTSSNDAMDVLTTDFNSQISKIMLQLQSQTKQTFDKGVDAVSKALDTGDIAKAKAAFATLEGKSNNANSSVDLTQKDKDFTALKNAINSGDMKSAKEAVTTIKTHSVQAMTQDLQNTASSYSKMAQNSYSQGAQSLTNLAPLLSSVA